MIKGFPHILLTLGFFSLSFTSQADTAVMDDVNAGFNLGTQSGLFVANATKACNLSEKEANRILQSQKKAGLALYGESEPDFSSNFDKGFAESLPLIQKSLLDGTLKLDPSVCKTLNMKGTQRTG